jgi:hypothetical protein
MRSKERQASADDRTRGGQFRPSRWRQIRPLPCVPAAGARPRLMGRRARHPGSIGAAVSSSPGSRSRSETRPPGDGVALTRQDPSQPVLSRLNATSERWRARTGGSTGAMSPISSSLELPVNVNRRSTSGGVRSRTRRRPSRRAQTLASMMTCAPADRGSCVSRQTPATAHPRGRRSNRRERVRRA